MILNSKNFNKKRSDAAIGGQNQKSRNVKKVSKQKKQKSGIKKVIMSQDEGTNDLINQLSNLKVKAKNHREKKGGITNNNTEDLLDYNDL